MCRSVSPLGGGDTELEKERMKEKLAAVPVWLAERRLMDSAEATCRYENVVRCASKQHGVSDEIFMVCPSSVAYLHIAVVYSYQQTQSDDNGTLAAARAHQQLQGQLPLTGAPPLFPCPVDCLSVDRMGASYPSAAAESGRMHLQARVV